MEMPPEELDEDTLGADGLEADPGDGWTLPFAGDAGGTGWVAQPNKRNIDSANRTANRNALLIENPP
ncbi:MAG: hypothetical protein V1728_01150 [Candidatus Micrarchaeota archaeon]